MMLCNNQKITIRKYVFFQTVLKAANQKAPSVAPTNQLDLFSTSKELLNEVILWTAGWPNGDAKRENTTEPNKPYYQVIIYTCCSILNQSY